MIYQIYLMVSVEEVDLDSHKVIYRNGVSIIEKRNVTEWKDRKLQYDKGNYKPVILNSGLETEPKLEACREMMK